MTLLNFLVMAKADDAAAPSPAASAEPETCPAPPDPSPPPPAAEASALDTVLLAAESTRSAVGSGIHTAARSLVQGAVVAKAALQEGYDASVSVLDQGKVYVDTGVAHYKAAEDQVFSTLKYGVEWGLANPYVAYPTAGLAAALTLPVTRRLLYRWTLGRLRNPEAVLRTNEGRVESMRTKLADFGTESQKLETRMTAAMEEMERGRAKLKAARLELQRLSTVVGKSERVAQGVLADLRTIAKMDNVAQIRGEAAAQVATLRDQRRALEKLIYKVASKDV